MAIPLSQHPLINTVLDSFPNLLIFTWCGFERLLLMTRFGLAQINEEVLFLLLKGGQIMISLFTHSYSQIKSEENYIYIYIYIFLVFSYNSDFTYSNCVSEVSIYHFLLKMHRGSGR